MTDGDKTGRSLPETPGGALEAGLYFVATPIGAARDITLRGLDILRGADVLAAEDTRTLRHLMEIHGIPLNGRPMIAYHDHNGAAARPKVLRALAAGLSVAYASEAGTPLVADPGFQLGRAAIAEGYRVLTAPGASAVLAALTVSGLPTDRFLFAGFPPNTGSARRKWLRDFAAIPATLVFYESPKRVGEMLIDLAQTCGEERSAAVCRELTKRFEEVRRGTIGELAAEFAGQAVRGEIVVVVDRGHGVSHGPEEIGAMLRERLSRMSVKDAATEVAEALDMPRREIYQMALKMEKDE
ncbi:16S rRNA (cytidine(1402)-2'-O)-methyltransferase [Paenirhodobacter populi]|uniref:Ribosomal RNA small subunit methyltransferase I n=1 Tax=Paenirhodobacter populi TaxID=2306993 RepID=A0A443IT84_9RHOB|nr:16S rRNA (cytidine(1402)-2'-O)-methyltransferase [Sinirhodobacter populi]RWR10527.1 16S rRNA (cytidine(1402)-2'-O)-methyltransferase [Sinirhodobacter populi]